MRSLSQHQQIQPYYLVILHNNDLRIFLCLIKKAYIRAVELTNNFYRELCVANYQSCNETPSVSSVLVNCTQQLNIGDANSR